MGRLVVTLAALVGAFAAPARAIEVVSPAPGTVVTPGQKIGVTILPSPGETVLQLRVITEEATFEAPPGILSVNALIPLSAVGPTLLTAFATLSDGEVDFVVIELTTDPGPLLTLFVTAPETLTNIGEVAPVEVEGLFQDGVLRELTLPETGTTYHTSNANVLGVHAEALVQARSKGAAQLVVKNSGRTRTVTVRVDVPSPPDNAIPIPNAGPDTVVAPESLIELSGLGSTDPDGDAITYRWQQEGGRPVVLHDSGTSQPFFISPLVSVDEVLEFSLVVRDERGATSFRDVVHVLVKP